MRRYSETVRADVRRRMSPPQRQSVARISKELGIHVLTLYSWRKAWRLQGEVMPASGREPEGWGTADKFTVVLETLNRALGHRQIEADQLLIHSDEGSQYRATAYRQLLENHQISCSMSAKGCCLDNA